MRTRLVALIGVAALTSLAGCGSDLGPDLHPGSAAIVADVDVSFGEVDDFANGICDWQKPVLAQDGRAWPMSYLKAVAVDSIVDDLLTHQFAEEKGLEPATGYKQAIAALEAEVAKADVPADVRATVIEFQSRGVYHEAVMVASGLSDLAGEGKVADQAGALQRGEEVFATWRDSVDVSVDPRFGTVGGDALDYAAPGDALSVGVSDVAKSAAASQADKEYVESLPPSQRCGGA